MLKFPLNITLALQFLVTPLFVLSFFSTYCFADLKINPSIQIAETYVASTAAAGFDNDFITTTVPGAQADYSGKQLSILSGFKLRNRSRLFAGEYYDVSHQYNIASSLGLMRDRITLSAARDFGQQLNNPLGTLNLGNRITSQNRVNRSSSRFEAQWNQPVGRLALGEMRYSLSQRDSGRQTLAQTRVDTVSVSLSSGVWFKRLFWNMAYLGTKYDNISRNRPASQSLLGLLGVRVLHNVDFSLQGGHEKNPRFSNSRQTQLDGIVALAILSWQINRKVLFSGTYGQRSFGESYNASLQLRPSSRLNLLASIEKSVIGSTFKGELSHQLRRSSWFVRYSERLVSFAIPVKEQPPQFFVDASGNSVFSSGEPSFVDILFPVMRNGFFVRRVFTLGSQLSGRRNTLRLSLNHRIREFDETDIKDKGYGGNVNWSLSLGKRGVFQLDVRVLRTSFGEAARVDDILRARVRYNHALGKQVSISGVYYYLERKSSNAAADRQQHVVSLVLNASY